MTCCQSRDPPKLKLLVSENKSIKQTLLLLKDYAAYLLLYQVVVLKIQAGLIIRLNVYVVSAGRRFYYS